MNFPKPVETPNQPIQEVPKTPVKDRERPKDVQITIIKLPKN
jgi:hypothetical protein